MEDALLPIVYTWRHRERNESAIPIHARSIKNGVVLQYLDGKVGVYKRTSFGDDSTTDNKEKKQTRIAYTPVTKIIGDVGSSHSLGLKSENAAEPNVNFGAAYVSAIEVSKYTHPEGEKECLFVSRSGGVVRKYDLPSGRLLAQTVLPFECRGLSTHLNHKFLIAWGYSCDMVALDQRTLQVKARWGSLPDWPLPTSLFDDQVLVFFKSGMASYWKIQSGKGAHDTVQQIKEPAPMIRLPPPPAFDASSDHTATQEDGNKKDNGSFEPKMLRSRKQSVITMFDRSHGFDPLISVKQVSEHSWVVARRHGWMLYKWENGTLVDEISADVSEGIISIITIDSIESEHTTSFGIITRASKVIWVSNGNVQVIEPVWNVKSDEIITCANYSREDNLLNCYVVTEHGINMYTVQIGPWPLAWDPTPFRIQTFKKTISYVSGVIGDKVVIGRGPDLLMFTADEFLNSADAKGQKLYSLDEMYRVTTLECIQGQNSENLVAAGTSDGRLVIVNADTSEVQLSLQLFATGVQRIAALTPKMSPKYHNLMFLVSLNSGVVLVDRYKKVVWKRFPSNDLNIIAISFTAQNSSWLVIQYEDKTRRIWDLEGDEEVDDITFYEAILSNSQFDKMSISSSSTRRVRVDQARKNQELDKLDNILFDKELFKPKDDSILVAPPPYSHSPLMIVRTGLLIDKFADALETDNHDKAENLYPTVKAVCASILHLPQSEQSRFDSFITDLFPKDCGTHEELGVGLLSTVPIQSAPGTVSNSELAVDLSLFSLDKKSPTPLLEIDGDISAAMIVKWITLIQLLAKYSKVDVPDVGGLYAKITAIKEIVTPNIRGLAKVLISRKGMFSFLC